MIDGITDPKLQALIDLGERDYGMKIKFRDEHLWTRVLNKVATIINKNFAETTTIVLGKTVYFTTREDFVTFQQSSAQTLAHELVHIHDKSVDKLHTVKYLFPQILSVFALLALAAIWGPAELAALSFFALFLAPIPAPFRAKQELRGYTMSLAMRIWETGHAPNHLLDAIVDQFSKSSYWFMMPFKDKVSEWLKDAVRDIQSGRITKDPIFRKIRDSVITHFR